MLPPVSTHQRSGRLVPLREPRQAGFFKSTDALRRQHTSATDAFDLRVSRNPAKHILLVVGRDDEVNALDSDAAAAQRKGQASVRHTQEDSRAQEAQAHVRRRPDRTAGKQGRAHSGRRQGRGITGSWRRANWRDCGSSRFAKQWRAASELRGR